MQLTDAEKAIVWLQCCTQLDYRERVALLRHAGDPKNLLDNFEEIASAVIQPSKLRLYNDRGVALSVVENFLVQTEKAGYFVVTLVTDDYPESLKAIPDPPLVLFGCGNRELLSRRKFCIVGSRITPPWAERQGELVSEILSERFAIVTGLAEGGDSAAISGAIKSGNLICVLPNGLNECYPASQSSVKEQVRRHGLLLSEYSHDEALRKYYFHARNRLLAGLSEGVLVLSAGEKSGALITAGRAAEYGRDVFAFPYNIGVSSGAGCNELIKKGAYLCTGAEDILSCYGIVRQERKSVSLTEEERTVYEMLCGRGELHTMIIAEALNKQIFEVSAILSALELKGLVVKSGGNRYSAV